jgi:antitoxin component of RelBE/YafQ-DinJ toxin-antitoxin module
MAKKFAGFKPETMHNKILPALGYNGPKDQKSINAFLAASPSAAAKMGKYTMVARQMVEGKPVVNANIGTQIASLNPFAGFGTDEYKKKTAATHAAALQRQADKKTMEEGNISQRMAVMQRQQNDPNPDPLATQYSQNDVIRGINSGGSSGSNATMQSAGTAPGTGLTTDPGGTSGDVNSAAATRGGGMPSGSNLTTQIGQDPTKPVTVANVVSTDGGSAALIPQNTGQAGAANTAAVTTGGTSAQAAAPTPTPAPQMTAAQSQGDIQNALSGMSSAQGQVSPESLMQAQTMDPNSAAALQLEAAQLGQAQTVKAPTPLQVTQDQLVDGSAVNQGQVDSTLAKAEAALVQDEMADLMQDFQGGKTPVWAAGAMRAANAAMAARGLSASSMAGMAITQAAMEAALPIAQMDASNKQEMAMMKAEQRARFMGMEFDQNFQTKVKNAARISEIANINFTAEQQVALENARMAQTVDLANLSNRQAKVMADAATMTQIDLANLDNRQQAAVQNAQAFLQMDMRNLDNQQQMTMFKAQETANSILSDVAAVNAARQFNATSQGQTDQFFAALGSQVQRFNSEQQNAMARFNAGEANALAQFNAAQENARDRFNAQNHLVIAQANAQWAQNITTAKNAAANQANRDAAMAANNLTMTAYNNTVQRERDLLAWAWQSGENARERDKAIAVATISASGGEKSGNIVADAAGNLLGKIANKAIDLIFL